MNTFLSVFVAFLALLAISGSNAEDKIAGGTVAATGQFPFMVRVVSDIGGGLVALCGGVIIDAYHIATAAHCFEEFFAPPYYVSIQAGTVHVDFEPQDLALHPISIIVNPNFAVSPLNITTNDVALIRMYSPLSFGSTIGSIALGTSLPRNGTTVYAAGWGVTLSGNISSDLLYVALPFVQFSTCNKEAGDLLTEGQHVCAGGVQNEGVCQGDSGGPLFTTSNIATPTDAKVIGLTSFGAGCGVATPSAWADVPDFAGDWLTETIASGSRCRTGCRDGFTRCKVFGGKGSACRAIRRACIQGCPLL